MKLQLPSDETILRELRDGGRNLPSNLAECIDLSKKHINRRLTYLEDYGLVDNIGNGLYEITPLGRAALEHIDAYNHGARDEFEARIRAENGEE